MPNLRWVKLPLFYRSIPKSNIVYDDQHIFFFRSGREVPSNRCQPFCCLSSSSDKVMKISIDKKTRGLRKCFFSDVQKKELFSLFSTLLRGDIGRGRANLIFYTLELTLKQCPLELTLKPLERSYINVCNIRGNESLPQSKHNVVIIFNDCYISPWSNTSKQF